jgi:hypothetical protein
MEWFALAVHRRRCPACRRFVKQVKWLTRTLRRWRGAAHRAPAALGLDPARRAVMRAAIRSELSDT